MKSTFQRAALATLRRQPVRALAAPLAQGTIHFGMRLRAGLAAAQPSSQAAPEESGQPPILIELLGPSGAGKTTLGKALIADKALRAQLRQFGGLKSSVVALHEAPAGTWGAAAHQDDHAYRELLRLKAENVLSRPLPIEDAARLLGFHVGVLSQDLRLTSQRQSTVVIRDEGLLHNFGADVLVALERGIPVQDLLFNRVVIRLCAQHSLIAQRAIARQLLGLARPQYVGLAIEEAEPVVAAASARIDLLTEKLRKVGVPSLTIDAAAPTEENVAVIRDFLPDAVEACRQEVPT